MIVLHKDVFKKIPKNISFRSPLDNKNVVTSGYNVLRTILNILFSLNSLQIIPRVSIIYLKHCYVNTLKTFTTLIQVLTLKHEKPNIDYTFIGSI